MTVSDQVVLLFGPSGIGKSTAIKYANERVSGIYFESLDRLTKQFGQHLQIISKDQGIRDLQQTINNPDNFLKLGIDSVNHFVANAPEKKFVIDVGAGFLDGSGVADWLSCNISVVLLASPEVAYHRIKTTRNDTRTFVAYRDQEFAASREYLYNNAQHKINAEGDAEKIGQALIELLGNVLSRSVSTEITQ